MNDSGLARVVNVLFSPAKTFEAIRQRPTWVVALLVLVVLGVVVGYLLGDRIDWEEVARDQLAQSGRQMSEEDMQAAIEFTEALGSKMVYIGPLLFGPIAYLLMALIYWVVLKMLGGELSYKASFATTLHGLMPNAIAALLTAPVVVSRGDVDMERVNTGTLLASNPGAFAPEGTSNAIRALLSSFAIFSFWSLFLLIVGFAIVARVPRARAAAVVIGLWVVYILFKVGAAAVSG